VSISSRAGRCLRSEKRDLDEGDLIVVGVHDVVFDIAPAEVGHAVAELRLALDTTRFAQRQGAV
jgi:hypothetical protein